ncbi:MAG: PAS domain S-box protein [Desulfobulbaceae bacterium]|uniref:histidine kinase n=1 Tax=Candidatus Desulfobia pelagia TaxID=2841692 RepID=A0A8J6NDP8_9BACT|nr:PAS domain S-box protein [Candidatus Desulfobia pelagia]
MPEAIKDLRSLYRSARRMARSDDVNVLFDCLVEDLANCTGLERILVLRRDRDSNSLESRVFYGFEGLSQKTLQVPFDQVNGLLRKVYTDREPLSVVGFTDTGAALSGNKTCGILRDGSRINSHSNRRSRINLCIADLDPEQGCPSEHDRFKHYSIMNLEHHDKTISFLLGDSRSFLILPICDDRAFYGYVLADKCTSGDEISYEEIRLAAAMTSHSAYAVGRALHQKKMVGKIETQLNEIEHLKSFYESIIQNLRSGLITVDRSMNISDTNNAAVSLLGYSHDELLGRPLESLFATSLQDQECRFFDHIDEIDTCMGSLAEVTMQRRDGRVFPVEICYSVITDREGEINGLSCIFKDISKRKELEHDLARVDKLASLGELAAGMAHEIKNPLAGIASALQVLARNFQKESPHQFIFNEVQDQVRRLDSFITDLLQFARPGKTNFSELDLTEIIDKALFLVSKELDDKHIQVQCTLAKNHPVPQGDRGQLQQVFLNIILNAIDAIEEGGFLHISSRWEPAIGFGEQRCVNPSCQENKGRVLVAFKDSGVGIAPDSLEAIFNPFHTSKHNGTGLGLSISQRVMEQHGGKIVVESEVGAGSTFTVLLPICVAGEAEEKVLQEVQAG